MVASVVPGLTWFVGSGTAYADPAVVAGVTATPDATFNRYFTRYGPGWTGADGTASVKLPNGSVAWTFSDTFLGRVTPQRTRPTNTPLARNSMMVQSGSTFTTLVSGSIANPHDLIPAPAGSWFWVGDATMEGNSLRVVAFRMVHTNTGFGFAYTGQVYVASFSASRLVGLRRVLVTGPSVMYGGALLENADGYTYIYGGEGIGFATYTHIARVRTGHLTDQAWQFYTGSGWSANPVAAIRVTAAMPDSVVKRGNKYVMFGIPTWGQQIMMSTAPTPVGPWSARTPIYNIPEVRGHGFAYGAMSHPEFGGQLLVSYNINSFNVPDVYRYVDAYRPKFIRVRI